MAKILIVDDEVHLIEMLQMRLEANGYEVVTAVDGEEGVEKVKSETPDLIILDIMMPKMDGYETCKILKNDPRYSKIPIIFLSARALEDDMQIGKEKSADALVKKPFETPDLLARIKELLEKSP
jgi:CheY-like chemotaxis protein